MLFGSGVLFFLLIGLGVCIDKMRDGDASMGCLIPFIIFGILLVFIPFILGALIGVL